MSIMNLMFLCLPALVLAAGNPLYELLPLNKRADVVCVVYTVVEYPTVTTICDPICAVTTVTSTDTITATTTTTTTAAVVATISSSSAATSDFSVSISSTSSTTQASASATATPICNNPGFAPGSRPDLLGGTFPNSATAPAVYYYNGATYSFGFFGTGIGTQAIAETNPATNATDPIIYYQVPSAGAYPAGICSTYGYLYDVTSGLCVTASPTSDQNAYPKYNNGGLILECCQTASENLPENQLFCTLPNNPSDPANELGVVFFGDTNPMAPSNNLFYAPIYDGPGGIAVLTSGVAGSDPILLQAL